MLPEQFAEDLRGGGSLSPLKKLEVQAVWWNDEVRLERRLSKNLEVVGF